MLPFTVVADSRLRTVLAQVPGHLLPGGTCRLCNYSLPASQAGYHIGTRRAVAWHARHPATVAAAMACQVQNRVRAVAMCPHCYRCGCTGPVLWPRPNRRASTAKLAVVCAWWCVVQGIAQRRTPAAMWRSPGGWGC